MRIGNTGRGLDALTLIGIGILGLATGDFVAVWQPNLRGVPAQQALAYGCAVLSVTCGTGLLWRRASAAAAGLLLAGLWLWLLLIAETYRLSTRVAKASR